MILRGKVHKFGDDINTDDIISAKYLNTTDMQLLASHCMETIAPLFYKMVNKGDIIVAGKNFGCGSSREHAPLAIKGCGISLVVAKSFARIFFRNAINIGLAILELAKVDEINSDDQLEVDLEKGLIKNITQNKNYTSLRLPSFMQDLISSGGLMNYIKERRMKQ